MIGITCGFTAYVKANVPERTSSHCIIHCQDPAVRKIPNALKMVLDKVEKILNFIKSRPLNSRIFSVLSNKMGSSYTTLLLHTEV
jgi:hypothetical protein